MWDKVKYSLLINIALFLLVFVLGYSAFGAIRNALVISREAAAAQKRIQELQQKKRELEKRLAALDNKDVVLQEAKERFNLKEPGEEVLVITPEKNTEPQWIEKSGIWTRIYRFFFSNFY